MAMQKVRALKAFYGRVGGAVRLVKAGEVVEISLDDAREVRGSLKAEFCVDAPAEEKPEAKPRARRGAE